MEDSVQFINKIPFGYKALIILAAMCGAAYYSYIDNYVPLSSNVDMVNKESETIDNEIKNISEYSNDLNKIEQDLAKAEIDLKNLLYILPGDVEIDKILANLASKAKESGIKIKTFSPNGSDGKATAAVPTTPGAPANPGTPAAAAGGTPPAAGGTPPATAAGGTPPAAAGGTPPATAAGPAGPVTAPVPPAAATGLPESVQQFPIQLSLEGNFAQIVTFLDKTVELPRIIKFTDISLAPTETDFLKIKSSSQLNVEAKMVAYYQLVLQKDKGLKN